MAKENTSIIVSGHAFDTGTRVVLWNEEEGMSLYPGGPWSKGRYTARDDNLKELRQKIKAFYIHHSVTYTAQSTFRGLKARNLSCNFIIDDDINENGCATIYQCLDVKDAGWSQGGEHNRDGAGVEISYYPDIWENPNRYNEYNRKKWGVQEHPVLPDKIHGHKFKRVWGPTEAQVKACNRLAAAYCMAFPDIPREFPRDKDGNFIATTVPMSQRKGLLHHFNVKRGKVDAMGYPTDESEADINSLIEEEKQKSRLRRSNIVAWIKKFASKK